MNSYMHTEKGINRNELSLWSEFGDYFQKNVVLLAGLYLAMTAVWGSWLVKDTVTFDAEGLYSLDSARSWYHQWFVLGRWMLVVLKKLLGVYAINPYFSNAVVFTLFPLSAFLWLFFMEKWNRESSPVSRIAFLLLYIAHPVWAYQFSYRMHMEVLTIAMTAMPLGMYFITEWLENNSRTACAAAYFILLCCFGCSAAFMFVYAAAGCIWFFIYLNRDYSKNNRKLLKIAAKTMGFTIILYASWRLISQLTGYNKNTPYVADQYRWGKDSFSICINRIINYIDRTMFGNERGFNALYGIVTILFIVLLFSELLRKKNNAVLRLVLGLAICSIPYALEFITAGSIVYRSLFSFPLSCAFMGAYNIKAIASFD